MIILMYEGVHEKQYNLVFLIISKTEKNFKHIST